MAVKTTILRVHVHAKKNRDNHMIHAYTERALDFQLTGCDRPERQAQPRGKLADHTQSPRGADRSRFDMGWWMGLFCTGLCR